jgi:carbamoyl-phosphate synthase small subunit
VRELTRRPSNFRATDDLSSYLARAGVLGIEGIDTRALTRRLRTAGVMPGIISDRADLSDDALVRMAREAPSMDGQNLVPLVGCNAPQSWSDTLGDWAPGSGGTGLQTGQGSGGTGFQTGQGSGGTGLQTGQRRYKVLALDCGVKANILRNLAQRGCDVVVVPHDTPASEIRRMHAAGEIDGLFVSNGPGDPAAVDRTIATLRDIVRDEKPVPTFGICLGHQLLALAAGAKTYKLKFGHRGANQPVLNTLTGKVEITSQNHGFGVDARSLAAVGGEPTHTHLNDDTLSGFRLVGKPVFAVQYHPEASPGPHDAGYLFDEFVRLMDAPRGRA